MYREILVPVDNSQHSDWAVERAVELCRESGGRITGSHVYAARLHDVRFRQLEVGLPAQFQEPQEIKRQRKIHDKLIEKGLQLISDSFLDQVDETCREAGVELHRQLHEGINYEELIREGNRGAGQLPSLIGFDPNIADNYDGGAKVRSDLKSDEDGRLVAEDEEADEKLAGTSDRDYDLVVMGAHGIGRQEYSQLGGVVSRVARGLEKDLLVVRDDRELRGGKWMVCVDGSAYGYKGLRIALELADEYGAELYVCSSFDVQYHHAVFHNIKDVLSEQASRVFKFEEQEELHNNVIDKGLLKLAQANIKRARVMAEEYPDVPVETQILVGKPFQSILQWAEEIDPSLLVFARHGAHRIEGTEMGSQAENLLRLADTNVLLVGTQDVRPEEVPWIEEDGRQGLEWTPQAEVRILRVPPFALGIARSAVEEFVLEHYGPGSRYAPAFGGSGNGDGTSAPRVEEDRDVSRSEISDAERRALTALESDGDAEVAETVAREQLPVVTDERLDEAIEALLPTHMQLVMGIGSAEELALAETKAEEAMERTVVEGHDDDPVPETPTVETRCPVTGQVRERERDEGDPVVWTHEAYARLENVPLIARPLARNTVERFARDHDLWRVTTTVMDDNKQRMIEADTFDADTMLVMFRELQSKQLKAQAEGVDPMTPEMRKFIEEAKASGVERCPIRDIAEEAQESDSCPVEFEMTSPEDAARAVEALIGDEAEEDPREEDG